MANENLVPYSFTPGTKAKASEMNANFNAISNSISQVSSTLSGGISTLRTDLESQISSKTDYYLTDVVRFSDGIYSAPNGIATYATNVITAKNGLSILIPSGRNSDGTLKNTSFTLDEDTTLELGSITGKYYLFLDDLSSLACWATSELGYVYKAPEQNLNWVYYDESENLWKYTSNGTDYRTLNGVVIAKVTCTSGIIDKLETLNPLGFLKETDISRVIYNCYPDYSAGVAYNAADTSVHTAPCDGIITIATCPSGVNVYQRFYINGEDVSLSFHSSGYMTRITGSFFVAKGDTFNLSLAGYSTDQFTFYPLKGAF